MTAISILCGTGNAPARLFKNTGVGTVSRQVEQDGVVLDFTEDLMIRSSIFRSVILEVRRVQTDPNQIDKQVP